MSTSNDDWSIRRDAVWKSEDQGLLINIAKNDEHWAVRKAAVEKLSEIAILNLIESNDNDETVRTSAKIRISELSHGEKKEISQKTLAADSKWWCYVFFSIAFIIASTIVFISISDNRSLNQWPKVVAIVILSCVASAIVFGVRWVFRGLINVNAPSREYNRSVKQKALDVKQAAIHPGYEWRYANGKRFGPATIRDVERFGPNNSVNSYQFNRNFGSLLVFLCHAAIFVFSLRWLSKHEFGLSTLWFVGIIYIIILLVLFLSDISLKHKYL